MPYAQTCYFTLDLPRYSSEEILHAKLLYAIENCPEIDGDRTEMGLMSVEMGFHIMSDDESDSEEDDGVGDSSFAQSEGNRADDDDAEDEALEMLRTNLYPYQLSLLSDSNRSLEDYSDDTLEEY